MKLTRIFVLTNLCILYLINYLLKSFVLMQNLVETTCILFISRYCIDSRFSTRKVVEEFHVSIRKFNFTA